MGRRVSMGYRFLSVEKGVLKINKGMCGSCASQCAVFGKSVKVDEELLTSNLGILGINLVVSLIYGVPILFLIFLSLIDHFLFVVDPLIAFFLVVMFLPILLFVMAKFVSRDLVAEKGKSNSRIILKG